MVNGAEGTDRQENEWLEGERSCECPERRAGGLLYPRHLHLQHADY